MMRQIAPKAFSELNMVLANAENMVSYVDKCFPVGQPNSILIQ